MKRIYFALIVFSFLNISCQDEEVLWQNIEGRSDNLFYLKNDSIPFTGTAIDKDDNGEIAYIEFKNGQPNGKYEYFFANGQLGLKANIVPPSINNENQEEALFSYEGIVKSYHKNGILESKKNYKAGIPIGVWEFYDSTGSKNSETEYFPDNGFWVDKYFYKDSTLRSFAIFTGKDASNEIDYSTHQMNWYPNGKLTSIYGDIHKYENYGYKYVFDFDEDGRIIKEEFYKDGKLIEEK